MKQELPLLTTIVWTVLTLLFCHFTYQILNFFLSPYFSHLRTLPGPPSKHWYFGWTTLDVIKDSTHAISRKHEEYGPVFYGRQLHRTPTLYVIDEEAVNYVFQNEFSVNKNNIEYFRRIPFLVRAASVFFGSTLLGVEGEVHKRQRKAMIPAFTESAVRQASSVMYDVSNTLMDVLHKDVEENKKNEEAEYSQIIISEYTKEVAMDTIGQAAFGHDLGALKKRANQLNESFLGLISMIVSPSYYALVRFRIPWVRYIGKYIMKEEERLTRYKEGIAAYADQLVEKVKMDTEKEGAEEDRNVFRLIKRASSTIKNGVQQQQQQNTISDEELREGVPILLLAGYETTASSLSWAFVELTSSEEGLQRQKILRAELKAEESQGWQTDLTILNRLPYLDAVCSEILRMHPVISLLQRVCWRDTVIPLASPVTLRDGTQTNQIPIRKGEFVYMSTKSMNTSTTLWGKDANKFLPERWLREGHPLFDKDVSQLTERARQVGGWNHIMTFGQGVRMCLGFRFALAEFKIVLANCIDRFDWKPAIDPNTGEAFTIESRGQSISKPALQGAKTGQYTLPILAKAI